MLQQCEILKTTAQGDLNEDTKASGPAGGLDSMVITDVAESIEASQPHRALIFCQMSSFMDIVITQVLEKFGIKHKKLFGAHSPR